MSPAGRGKIKARRHASQRNDTAIKLDRKVVCVIYFVIICTFVLVGDVKELFDCIHGHAAFR